METTQAVVLSVLITLWTVGLVLAIIGLRKAHKISKQNSADIAEIERRDEREFEDIRRQISSLENHLSRRIDEAIDAAHNRMDSIGNDEEKRESEIHRRIDECHIKIDQKTEETSRMVEELHREEERSLDRRFDRIYQMLYEAFPHLKKD